MTHAYDKLYLEKARVTLGSMLDYAVYDLDYDISEFFTLFIESGIANAFEQGSSKYIAGKSGIELVYEVLNRTQGRTSFPKPRLKVNRSKEYWLGWALAYYQWESRISFASIIEKIPIKDILALYAPYHEMDIHQFVDKMNELYKALHCKPEELLEV